MTRAAWEREGYSEVIATDVDDRGGVHVTFGNGDKVDVPERLIAGAAWDRVAVDRDDPLEIHLVSGDETVQRVGWAQIRAATDPKFAQHMRELDAEESRRLGRRLKALREDRGVKQAELASALNMSAPQLSKIEAGTHDMRVSTVRSLLRALNASFADIAGPDVPEVSLKRISGKLASTGVDSNVIRELLGRVPRKRAAAFLERVFGTQGASLAAGVINTEPLRVAVQFKATTAPHLETSPLLHLANAVAEAGRVATTFEIVSIPDDPEVVRASIEGRRGAVSLRSLVEFVWEHGIPVLPMTGRGSFVASAWQVSGGPAIVLKEPRDVPAFWMFDLAHELGHIALGHTMARSIVDVDEPTSEEGLATTDDQEREANEYALNLLVPDYPARIAEVRRRSQGNYLRFKDAVDSTARDFGVNAGVLGVVAAHELTEIGEHKDRWGSSINLSKRDGDGRAVVQSAARHYLDLRRLPDEERALISSVVLNE